MSGHNKWSKIKHKKAITDAQKSKVFSKFAHLIALESKKAKGDISSPALRAAIERAKQANMPSGNIEKAVKKGGAADAGALEEVMYEAYGPGGAALIIEGITDNKNRTGAEVKHILTKNGLSLAARGAASWAFVKIDGEWQANQKTSIEESDSQKLEKLIDELEENDDIQSIYTNAE